MGDPSDSAARADPGRDFHKRSAAENCRVDNGKARPRTARDAGPLDLSEALELTALICLRDRSRGERYARRWLARELEERPAATLDEAVLGIGALRALGGPAHDAALAALRAISGEKGIG